MPSPNILQPGDMPPPRRTVSIAIPSSILLNAQSSELRVYLAGQVARAAAIFRVDEVVIFDEYMPVQQHQNHHHHSQKHHRQHRPSSSPSAGARGGGEGGGETAASSSQDDKRQQCQGQNTREATQSFARLLTYLDTPQYLRKHLFPVSPEFRLVGLLNPLALPSHLSRSEMSPWREGVTVSRSGPTANGASVYPPSNQYHQKPQHHHHHHHHHHQQNQNQNQNQNQRQNPPQGAPTRYADVGLDRLVELDTPLPPGRRITVDMTPSGPGYARAAGKYLFGLAASRDAPPDRDGVYWGYRVRTAPALSAVFAGGELSPRGYDLTIGTSERGAPVARVGSGAAANAATFALPDFRHALVVFGGVHGLERSVIGDARLEALGISPRLAPTDPDAAMGAEAEATAATKRKSAAKGDGDVDPEMAADIGDLFDFYLNTCPNQGSRTIRTEEAILITMAALNPLLNNPNPS